jgi:hypothetical protein
MFTFHISLKLIIHFIHASEQNTSVIVRLYKSDEVSIVIYWKAKELHLDS